jgi:hypothetical protein
VSDFSSFIHSPTHTVVRDERAGLGYVALQSTLTKRMHTIDRNRFIPHKQSPQWLICSLPYQSDVVFNIPTRWMGTVCFISNHISDIVFFFYIYNMYVWMESFSVLHFVAQRSRWLQLILWSGHSECIDARQSNSNSSLFTNSFILFLFFLLILKIDLIFA